MGQTTVVAAKNDSSPQKTTSASKPIHVQKTFVSLKPQPKSDMEKNENLNVGDRISTPKSNLGTLRYIGEVNFAPGSVWAGVELDTPSGKNDGAIKHKR